MKSEFFCTTLNNDYQHLDSLANSHMPCIRYEFGTKVAEKPEPLLSLFIAHSLCILCLGFVSTVTRVSLLLREKREEMLVKLLGTPRTCVIGERERERERERRWGLTYWHKLIDVGQS